MMKKSTKKGFSLVELIVVIAIIAILSVVAYTAVGGQTGKAKNSRRTQDLGTMQSALEIYFIENGNKYPAATTDLVPKYMPKLPKDPSSTDATTISYKYIVNGSQKEYQLGATHETETTPYMKAYVIGNGSGPMGGVIPGTTTACSPVTDTSTTCVPYTL